MTAEEWLACTDPTTMARFLCDELRLSRKPAARRKLRLYACACCRRAWHLLRDEQSREAVEIAEGYAEGVVKKAELDRVWNGGKSGFWFQYVCAPIGRVVVQVPYEATSLLGLATDIGVKEGYRAAEAAEQVVQATLLRDIFGNPLSPVPLDASWLTSTVVQLGRGIYDEKAFDRMPILADALQDAGCDSDDVLNHCRNPKGVHVRGCWVVDLILGKA